MTFFAGFQPGDLATVSLPERFFSEVLPHITNVVELKLILYTFWRLANAEDPWLGLQRDDFSNDTLFMSGLAKDEQRARADLDAGLRDCVAHGILLDVAIEQPVGTRTFYFINSERGRAACEAIREGKWRPQDLPAGIPLSVEKPNIFRLYEENIGVLTPMIADMLRDAEVEFPAPWIEEAMQIAVAKNARNWRYIEAILRRWKEDGRDQPEDRGESDRRKYVEGKYAEFINR